MHAPLTATGSESTAKGQFTTAGDWLGKLLQALPTTKIGVVGDFCLDVYWDLDLSAAERSVETGLMTRPVREQRYELGGAGNIVNNLVALGVGTVQVFGVIGKNPFGREMQRLLESKGVGRDGLLAQAGDWDTLVYLKPIREGREESRLDFGNFNRLRDEVAEPLLAKLDAALPGLDVLIINQQVVRGIHTEFFQAGLNNLLARQTGSTFLADSRHVAGAYGSACAASTKSRPPGNAAQPARTTGAPPPHRFPRAHR